MVVVFYSVRLLTSPPKYSVFVLCFVVYPDTEGIKDSLSLTKSTNSSWLSIPAPQTNILFGVIFSN